MSRNELLSGSSQIHTADFQLVAGTGFLAVANIANYYLNVSKILELKCVNPVGAAAGTAVVTSVAIANTGAVGAHTATITVASSANTDGSLYRLFWVNEVVPSSGYAQ